MKNIYKRAFLFKFHIQHFDFYKDSYSANIVVRIASYILFYIGSAMLSVLPNVGSRCTRNQYSNRLRF